MYAVTHANRQVICLFPDEESAREWLLQRAARAALESFRDFKARWLICVAPGAGGAVGGEIAQCTARREGRALTIELTGPAS